ncbi:hypothetical protein [Nocardia sp.]|uniref:hypothetical protein n=1 Tax=Nocardia sp. TaxID=1821 RepID=UPI00262E21EA|nr:hypothetical protein [Nocardia sp.]
MTQKQLIGRLVAAFACAAVVTLNPSAAWSSGDVGAPPAAGPGGGSPHGSTPAGGGAEHPVPAPERIVPVPPPSGGLLCPTP